MVKKRMNKRQIIFAVAIVIIFVLGSGLRTIVNFITDFQWFGKNEFLDTFLVKILTEIGIIIPLWVLMGVGLYIYILKLKKKYYENAHVIFNKEADQGIHRGIGMFSFFFAFFIAWQIGDSIWLKLRMFFSAVPFEKADPIFGKNIEFYIFKLPLYQQLLNIIILLTILITTITFIFYFLMLNIRPPAEDSLYDLNEMTNKPIMSSVLKKELVVSALRKLAFLGMIVLLMLSFKYYLKGYELLYSGRGVAYGASYTDIHVTLIAYRVLAVTSFVSAFAFATGLLKKNIKWALAGPVILIAINIFAGIMGLVVQQLIVEPDEINKETEYLIHNIEHTQDAFGLNDVKEIEFPVEQNLTQEDLKNNVATVKNIRINDARPLRQTYNQIQGIRLYYEFNNIDTDRYVIDGAYTQVFVSPRELNQQKLGDQAKTWVNIYLKYTHGYGLVMSPVNAVTKEGQPQLIFKNVPPITETDLKVNRPEIYFGELTNNYIIVNTEEPEFDYPFGSDNKIARYEGNAGIEIGGINKLLFAYRERSMKMLVSTVLNKDSRIVIYRNILQRVNRIAPFLEYDSNPYLVVNQEDGKLYWIIDAYTTSQYYPYSQPFALNKNKVNYVRNSVKVVVDAYEGTTKFYVYDENDPILKTYDKIFKDLFTDKSEMPEGLLSHIRYPQDYFDVQSEVYRPYHVDNPIVFYNGEDIWDIANEKYMAGIQRIESNYVMFKLPDAQKEEFALIVPYTPKEKANMTSLLVARNDGENYGKLYIYKFPKDKMIQGPMMIESRIDQDSVISPQFTLWGQEGSTVLRGNLIVVPIENSLLYIEPIYLKADNPNSLPEMKRVIVTYENKIVMEENLDDALIGIFGAEIEEEIKGDDGEAQSEIGVLLDEIKNLFDESKGNIEELENLINELNERLEKE